MSESNSACYGTLPWCVILILILVLGIPWAERRRKRDIGKVENQLGFRYQNRRYSVEHRGREFQLWDHSKSYGGRGEFTSPDYLPFTRIKTSIEKKEGIYLLLKPAGLIGQIIAAIGIQGIAIGMLSIDENFLMISKPKDVGKQLLYTPNILEQVFVFNPTILRIRLDVLLFEQAGYLKRKSRDYYLSLFDLLCDIAEIMESFDKLSNYLGNPTNE